MHALLQALRRAASDLAAVVFPPVCAVCRELRLPADALVCAACWSSVEYLTGPCCPHCGRPHPSLEDDDLRGMTCGKCLLRRPPFDAGLSLGSYRGTLRALIRLMKFSDRPELARPLAARAAACLRVAELGRWDLVVPVPLPTIRRLRRGYNQSAEVAREIAALTGAPVAIGALRRGLWARTQASLPARSRSRNVRGSFRPGRGFVALGKTVLLVDDVWTTGATLAECSRILRRAGARRIIAFSLARAPEDFDLRPPGGLH